MEQRWGTGLGLRCLECVECRGQHTLESVREGRFYVSVMTCRGCLAKAANSRTCFGKSNRVGRRVGYLVEDFECRLRVERISRCV